jgi:hypothetical protein
MNRQFTLSSDYRTPILSTDQGKPVISTGAFAYFANAEWRDPCICICLCLCFFLAPTAHAQGCAQCLDSTRATPPSVQAAYRHAILLLGSAAATLFIAATLLLRRQR